MHSQRLRDQLYVDIDYPQHFTDAIGTVEPWKRFCSLPLETKKKFEFLNHQNTADPGYRWRRRAEGREDKEYFHSYPNIFELAEKDGNGELARSEPAIKGFFEYAIGIQKLAFDFALGIQREMGKDIPELVELIDNGRMKSVLRFLHYTNDEKADIIADQHFDRSLFTLHLYESGPGLQFLNWNMQWTDAPIGLGKTVIFNGYRMEELTKGKLQKTWHRVVRKDDIKDRISMVLFVWTDAISSYARDARSQDMQPSYVRE